MTVLPNKFSAFYAGAMSVPFLVTAHELFVDSAGFQLE